MKRHLIITALLASSSLAIANNNSNITLSEQNPSPQGNLLNDINLFGDEFGDESTPISNDALTQALTDIHKSAYEKLGLQFVLEQAFRYSKGDNAAHNGQSSGKDQSWYKIHAQAGIQLFESARHQGTWIKGELSGSVALNKHSGQTSPDEAWGASGPADCDIFEDGYFYMPELLLSQGFMDGELVIMGGIINQTNYYDINSYANSTFGQFGAAPFVNNQVLPLGDSNFGFIAQYQFNDNWLMQIGGNMMDNEPNRNPFKHTSGKAWNLIAELTWTHDNAFNIGAGAYRLQPFLFHANGKNHGGIAFNAEQDLGESPFALFARAGWSSAEASNLCGASAQVSGGIVFKKAIEVMTGLKEADSNYLGVGISFSKPDADTLAGPNRARHDREMILECSYSYAITPYCLIQPSYQHVKNPAGRGDVDSADIISVQCVLTF